MEQRSAGMGQCENEQTDDTELASQTMFRGDDPGVRVRRRKGQYGGRCGRKLEEKGMWGGGCPPGEPEREETPQRRGRGRDEPGQGKAREGKERKTSPELQVGGSQPPFSSPIPLFHGLCRPPRKTLETPTRMGARGWAGENAQVFPGQGGGEGNAGYRWQGGGKGQQDPPSATGDPGFLLLPRGFAAGDHQSTRPGRHLGAEAPRMEG
ncbi:uncharacterized protein LOC121664890 isoform X1 [Corvus kubaryi]|uniref:uncharacterized protein LOC121664890 isoform X1 n=1 Tax=Corvus kubaryi TaxID=68294 RepID=UPI001C04558F|nr:uncharacterized protein LOC121664890 isoform X1 [Corvus kubaryi]